MNIFTGSFIMYPLLLGLSSCQGVISPTGQVTGFTLPPNCSGKFVIEGPPVSYQVAGSCTGTSSATTIIPP
jgi:hypothetical protein